MMGGKKLKGDVTRSCCNRQFWSRSFGSRLFSIQSDLLLDNSDLLTLGPSHTGKRKKNK